MQHFLSICLLNTMFFMAGCNPQAQQKTTSTPQPSSNTSGQNANKPGTPEIKEGEILKPGKLQVEVPEDFPLPESAIVAMGTKLGSSGKKHFYIQIPDMESAQKVTEYFAVELPKHGWELLNGKGEERIANTISLDFKNENELGRVDSIIKQERAGTIVHVHLEPIKK